MVEPKPPPRPRRSAKPPAPPEASGTTPARKDELKTAGWRITEAGAAVAAFLLSLSIFLLGTFQSLRGSEIVLLPPQFIILYRDAPTPTSDVLMLAVETGMINTARADYGDVAVQAYAEVAGTAAETARFPHDGSLQPVHLKVEEDRTAACPVDARCVPAIGLEPPKAGRMGLMVIERRPELLSVPGGSSHSAWLGFSLGNCRGQAEVCDRYARFTDALQQLRRAPELSFRVTLDFHSDGRKTFLCASENQSAARRREFLDFLEERGWAALTCRRELRS